MEARPDKSNQSQSILLSKECKSRNHFPNGMTLLIKKVHSKIIDCIGRPLRGSIGEAGFCLACQLLDSKNVKIVRKRYAKILWKSGKCQLTHLYCKNDHNWGLWGSVYSHNKDINARCYK